MQQAKIDYGTQVLPGTAGNHATIAGPDNWVVYDHGAARTKAALEFLRWFTGPEQSAKWSLATGSLPIRTSTTTQPGFDAFSTTYPGNEVFVANLANATKAKPRVTALPQVFDAIGKAVASTLLGKTSAKAALDDAKQAADSALAAG